MKQVFFRKGKRVTQIAYEVVEDHGEDLGRYRYFTEWNFKYETDGVEYMSFYDWCLVHDPDSVKPKNRVRSRRLK